jgi:sentrin-specific protease 1
MKGFRLKLAAILISSLLNVRRGRPLFLRNDDEPGNPNDVVEIDDSKQLTTTPSHGNHNGNHDRDGNCIVGQQGTPDIIITQQNSTRSHRDQSKDEFLDSISKRHMNLRREDMIGILCDYIASFAVALE